MILLCPVQGPWASSLAILKIHKMFITEIIHFSSETTEQNSTKLDRKLDLNVLYQVYVFWADPKNKMATLASDWLRHFRLLLWNCWMEFNETWQEARSQHPLTSLCFSVRWETQDGRPGLWWAETFSTSPLNGIQRNLTGSKISTFSNKFVFFRPIGKTRWAPCPLICWDIFLYARLQTGRIMVWWCPSGSSSVHPTLRPSVRLSVRPGLRPPVFHTFLLHALTYWAEILHMTLFWCTTDQVRLSSLCVNFWRSYASVNLQYM